MLEGDDEDRKPRALPCLGELLQDVRVGFAAVPNGLQGLPELVHHQEQGRPFGETPSDFDDDRRSRPAARRIRSFQIPQGLFQEPGRGKVPRGGNPAVGPDHRRVERPQQSVGDGFAVRGHQTAVESGPASAVPFVRLPDAFRGLGRRFGDQAEGDVSDPLARTERGVEQEGEGGLPGTVGTGERPRAPGPPRLSGAGHSFDDIERPGGDDVSVEGFRPARIPFEIGRTGETGPDGDVVSQASHQRAPAR